MPKFIAISFVLLSLTVPAFAAGEEGPTPLVPLPAPAPPAQAQPVPSDCVGLRGEDYFYCLALEIDASAPCAGTVEERLTCLEARLLRQQREIALLKRSMFELMSPRIRPLTSR